MQNRHQAKYFYLLILYMIIKLITCSNAVLVTQKLIQNFGIPDLLKSIAEFPFITVSLKSLLSDECCHAARQTDV